MEEREGKVLHGIECCDEEEIHAEKLRRETYETAGYDPQALSGSGLYSGGDPARPEDLWNVPSLCQISAGCSAHFRHQRREI